MSKFKVGDKVRVLPIYKLPFAVCEMEIGVYGISVDSYEEFVGNEYCIRTIKEDSMGLELATLENELFFFPTVCFKLAEDTE